MQIPESNKGLSDLAEGKKVLAQYPDTTTFYKAEVSETWRSKDLMSEKGEWVKLNFHDDEQTREVERRFVLTEK
jgi:SAGA-associated factor 29